MKKITFLFCAIITMAINSVNAQTWNCGAQGNNLTATLSGSSPNYTLTISGSGDMEDYDYVNYIPTSPWYSYNSSMKQLVIEEGVKTIGNYAFLDCYGFTGDLIIPNSVTIIGDCAFRNCYGFTGDLIIPNSVTIIGDWAFRNCYGFDGNLTIPNSVKTIGASAFSGCSGLTGSLTIPNSITIIENSTFYNCSKLIGNLTIPNSVTTIGNGAFNYCYGFNGTLTIGNSVTSIGDYAFHYCWVFIGDLIIPNSVTFIGNGAFNYCYGFNGTLTIGNSVTSIGDYAFHSCDGLTSIIVDCTTPPILGDDVFYNVQNTIPVYVPCGTASSYAGTTGWDYFTNFQGFISAPTNLTVTQQNATLELAWQNTGATSYEIWRNSTLLTTTASTTYTDSNVSNGTNYCYQIKAINSTCESQLSTAVCKTFNIPSNDATLANLTVSAGTLSPAFSSTTYSYTVNVANEISSITISATANHLQANVSGDIGLKNLSVGNNPFTITVTAEDGTTQQNYYVTVTRANTIGIEELTTNSGITVYPNPTNGQLAIRNYQLGIEGNIEIYDISGRMVQTQLIVSQRNTNENEISIDISHLQQGMYYLRIGNETVKIIRN